MSSFKPPKRELFVKSLVYRLFVIMYEAILALIVGYIGFNILEFVAVNNLIKIAGYFIVELWWFRYLRTRFMLLEKLILNRVRGKRLKNFHDKPSYDVGEEKSQGRGERG